MHKWGRNKRLYQHLLAMGLYVDPIYYEGNTEMIDAFHVSSGVPHVGLSIDVCRPLEGSQVAESVGPSAGDGHNVIDFPPKL